MTVQMPVNSLTLCNLQWTQPYAAVLKTYSPLTKNTCTFD